MHDNTMTCTRPDIAYVVGRLSSHISSHGKEHWDAVNRAFKYLKQTMDYGLEYRGDQSVLEGYTDASWITNQEDYASMNEWIFTLGGGYSGLGTKKQSCLTDLLMAGRVCVLTHCKEDRMATQTCLLLNKHNPYGRNLCRQSLCIVIVNLHYQECTIKCTMGSEDYDQIKDYEELGWRYNSHPQMQIPNDVTTGGPIIAKLGDIIVVDISHITEATINYATLV
ncbi:hypothetical protein Tco_0694337 [Tanacetum coccineum]